MHIIYTRKVNIYKYTLVFKNADFKINQKYGKMEKFKILFYCRVLILKI